MNIIWITENFPPSVGGVQKYIYNTIVHLDKCKSTIITKTINTKNCSDVDDFLLSKGDEVVRVGYIPNNIGLLTLFKSFSSIIKLCILVYGLVRTKNISLVIFGHASYFNLYVNFVLKCIIKTPLAIVFHGEDVPSIRAKSAPLHKWLISKADIHICNSKFTEERLIKFCGVLNQVFVAYPGVEDKFFQNVDSMIAEEKFGATNRRIVYTVGRIDPRKGHELILRSLPQVIEHFPDVMYLIGGTGNNSELLTAMVDELNLRSHVRFCGYISDEEIVSFHQIGEIFVMPNRIMEDGDTEGFGIVFLEANASGKPVIGGAFGGALDSIENGLSGYLVGAHSSEELAERIIYLLANPDEAEKMGRYGRERAWASFRWSSLAGKLENFIHESI